MRFKSKQTRFRKWVWVIILIAACGVIAAWLLPSAIALAADGIAIGGQDASAQMKDVQNLITTLQTIGFKWIAKLIGGFLVVAGIYKIACRDFASGILATGGGGTLFFVEKIAESLSKMNGS